MSIDREFTLLNQTGNSLNNGKNTRNSVNEGKIKPGKMVNFVKDSTLKYLVPALIMTFGSIEFSKNNQEKPPYDESGAPLILENSDIDYITAPSTDYYFSIPSDNINDNYGAFMYDEVYNQNYTSSILQDEELNYAPGTHISQTNKEYLYQAMYKKLSLNDYQNLFKGLKNLRQGSLGNCYFVVAIKNLARSKYFDTLMMTSLERIGEDSFNLYMPLGEPGGMKISITKEDLEASTIGGPLGYKILEIGFAKYLLFSKGIISNPDAIITDDIMEKMEAGSSGETMISLLGPKSFINKCIKNNTSNKQEIFYCLRSYNPMDLGIISATSKFKEGKTDQNFYEVGGETVYYGHAYCICGVEKEGGIIKSVILENPWNRDNKKGGHMIKLSIDDFFDGFSLVNVGHITENFLNFSTSYDEVKVIDSRNRRKS